MQVVLHAVSQQKPSTQNPVLHCSGRVQAPPTPESAVQTAPLHQAFAVQSASVAQEVLQEPVPHP
jgi:hypothetical protein